MAAYLKHFRALARRIQRSEGQAFAWRKEEPGERLFYFLAMQMEKAGFVNASHREDAIHVTGLTRRGRTLTNDVSTEHRGPFPASD